MHRPSKPLLRSLALALLLAPVSAHADTPWWLVSPYEVFQMTPSIDTDFATTNTLSSGPGTEAGPVGGTVLIDDDEIDYMLPSAPAYLSLHVEAPRSPSLAVDVGWYNTSEAGWARLHRSLRGGAYTLVNAHFGALGAGTNSSIRDSAPPIDDEACYQIEVGNEYGSARSEARCLWTPDGQQRPLWRAQLRVAVANIEDAGTDAPVRVRLNSPYGVGWSPSGNETWIDTPADDFEARSTRDYELLLSHTQGDVSDVKRVSLHVDEDDPLCVRRVELRLNEQTAFVRSYGNANCLWVNLDNDLEISHAELRASPAWQAMLTTSRPVPVSYELIDAAATAAVGNAFHGRDVEFRETSTNPTVTQTSGNRRVYEWDVSASGFPVTLQAELLTETTCEQGSQKGRMFVGAVDVDAASWVHLVEPLSEVLVEYFEPTLSLPFSEQLSLGSCAADIHLCFTPAGVGPSYPVPASDGRLVCPSL